MTTEMIRRAGNRALDTNPPNAHIHLGRWGSDWGWVVFCVMAASTIGLFIWSFRLPRGRRTFPYLLTAVLAISTISWYSQASDLGATPIPVQFLHNSRLAPGGVYPTRQIWYSRYIDWALTVPLLLLTLLLITGLPLSVIFITLFFSVFMIICGLLGALTRTRYKWGYFAFGCAALGYVLYHVFASGLRSARRLDHGFDRAFLAASTLLGVIWPLYPLCWSLTHGGNVIGVSAEFLWFGLLDLISKPVYAFLLLAMLRNCDYGALRLQSGKVTESNMTHHEQRRAILEKDQEGLGSSPAHRVGGSSGDLPPDPQPPAHQIPPAAAAHTRTSPVVT